MSALSELAFVNRNRERRITVLQGSFAVSAEQGIVLTTILGSCVAVCLYDPQARIGGMNHFLLAEPGRGDILDPLARDRYGAFAMEELINAMMKQGAVRANLRAHIYGGANIHAGIWEIGTSNAQFAEDFLERDRIIICHRDTGGMDARRLEMRPSTGQVRCRHIPTNEAPPVVKTVTPKMPDRNAGEVELF
jgi:chemotaxis protein CheD